VREHRNHLGCENTAIMSGARTTRDADFGLKGRLCQPRPQPTKSARPGFAAIPSISGLQGRLVDEARRHEPALQAGLNCGESHATQALNGLRPFGGLG
jgi:hypothetical protein